MRYRAIQEHDRRYPIRLMCRALAVSAAGYYAWRSRPESARSVSARTALAAIRGIHRESRETYGSPSIWDALVKQGHRIGEHRVARLMRQDGIRAKTVKKWRPTTQSQHRFPVATNTLNRQFTVEAPNRVWAGDLSAPCRRGWRQTNYAGWLPTGSWNAAPLGKDSGRKGAAKLRQVPMAGCHKQSSLNSTGHGPLPTSRATIGSMVRQRSVRRKPLYLEQPTLNDGMAWRDCGAIRLVLMLPTEGCARRIRRWDVL